MATVVSFVVNLGISERNFRGRGQNVVARLEWGSLRQQVDFRFTEPKFLGRDLRAGFDLFHSRYDLSQYSSYDYRSTGAGLRLSYPLNGNMLLSTRYFLKSDEIIVPTNYCTTGGSGSTARRSPVRESTTCLTTCGRNSLPSLTSAASALASCSGV